MRIWTKRTGYVILLLLVLLVLKFFFTARSVGEMRFLMYRADMANYLSDELYKTELQTQGSSYMLKEHYLYTYGLRGFTIINLDNGDITYLVDTNTNEWFKTHVVPKWSQQKRVKENLDLPYIRVLPDESSLTDEERNIREKLMTEYIKYPVQYISSGRK